MESQHWEVPQVLHGQAWQNARILHKRPSWLMAAQMIRFP